MLWWWIATALAANVDSFQPSSAALQGVGSPQGEDPQRAEQGLALGVHGALSRNTVEGGVARVRAPAYLHGGWGFNEQWRIDLLVPTYTLLPPSQDDAFRVVPGDLRLQAVWRLDQSSDQIQFGLIPQLYAPTGNADEGLGGAIQGGLVAAVSSDASALKWLFNVGFRGASENTVGGWGYGSHALGTGALWYELSEGFSVGTETATRWDLASGPKGSHQSAVSSLFFRSLLPEGLALTVSGGYGWLASGQAPDLQISSQLTFSPQSKDQDGDGIIDAEDACPESPEDMDDFRDEDGCPEFDNDGDMILDEMDGCPNEPEDVDGFEDSDGCPDVDNDNDGVLDTDDLCPDIPGVDRGCPDRDGDTVIDIEDECPDVFGSPDAYGCPDRDGDQVPDKDDKCPDEPGYTEERRERRDGCPRTVFLAEASIEITERIEFKLGSDELLPIASPILDQIGDILLEMDDITLIEVAGHADASGRTERNEELSLLRAIAVVEYLVGQGVARARMLPTGYGARVPRSTNRTDEGRQGNRRVEFLILEQTAKDSGDAPEATWPQARTGADPEGAPGSLTLRLAAERWADIYIDGAPIVQKAPFVELTIPGGAHEIRAINGTWGINWREIVVVPNGQNVERFVPSEAIEPVPSTPAQ